MSVMPYMWAAALKGTVTTKGIPSYIDASFPDIFDALDYAFFGQLELARNRCFILTDGMVIKAAVQADTERRFLGLLGLVDYKGSADVNLESFIWFQELLGGYRVYECNLGSCPDQSRRFSFDVLAGIRYYKVDLDLNASAKVAAVGPRGRVFTRERSGALSDSEDWIDPLVGARMQYDLTHRLALIVKGDVGGFGVGSDFAWSAAALAKYQLCDHWSILGGYKVLDVDYDNDKGGAMDVQMTGPVAGVQYKIEF